MSERSASMDTGAAVVVCVCNIVSGVYVFRGFGLFAVSCRSNKRKESVNVKYYFNLHTILIKRDSFACMLVYAGARAGARRGGVHVHACGRICTRPPDGKRTPNGGYKKNIRNDLTFSFSFRTLLIIRVGKRPAQPLYPP